MPIISPQTGAGFSLQAGDLLRVIDLEGEQVSDLFCFSAADPRDALSSGRSIDYNDSTLLTKGHKLFAHSGKVMFEILEDSCGVHDFLVTPCSLQMFQMLDPACEYHPSCQENLAKAFAPHGKSEFDLGSTFNIFMNVPVAADGSIKVKTPLSKAGDSILLKAKMDLIVGLTACSDEGTNNGRCKPIEYQIIKGVGV